MVTYYVKKGDIYKVTATVNCAVYNANGAIITTCDAGDDIYFNAPTAKITLSDDNAALTHSVENSIDVDGVSEHLVNSNIHVSTNEKANWNRTVDTVITKTPIFDSHLVDSSAHVTAEERSKWDFTTEHADIVWNINKMFPGQGNGGSEIWNQFYAIRQLRKYFYNIDVTNGDSNFTYSKQMMVSGIKLRHYRAARSGYIPDPIWATYTWKGGTIDWTWDPDVDGETNKFDDFSNTTKWEFEVTEHMLDAHLEGETTDVNGNELFHITSAERTKWNGYQNQFAPKNLGVANAILITDANGDVVPSTIISVAELNTLNNNLTNISTKLSDFESRIAALETT